MSVSSAANKLNDIILRLPLNILIFVRKKILRNPNTVISNSKGSDITAGECCAVFNNSSAGATQLRMANIEHIDATTVNKPIMYPEKMTYTKHDCT